MGKSLSQITFDFAPVEETENTPTAISSVIEKEMVVMEEKKEAKTSKEETKVVTAPVVAPGKRGRKSLKESHLPAPVSGRH